MEWIPKTARRKVWSGGLAAACVLGSLGVGLASCASTPEAVDYARAFPRELPRRETLDIQVFRDAKEIEFTNTTAASYGPSTLWLNGRFSRPIPGLAVGETLKFRLREFRDQYNDAFREGGFWATEKPEKLVLAQLETTDSGGQQVMLGLIVVGTESDE